MTTTFIERTKQAVKETITGLANIGTFIGKEALKAGVRVATTTAAKWILQYCGGFDIG
jgi:hypothetical protein